ncbi:MAG: hypothetical protein Q9203_005062 [Teloschistes exilis]
MAPRRGGGGGGGSSSGLDDTVWGQGVRLPGTHFHSPYPTAQIVFEGIGIVGIVAIMVWAAMFKKPHQPFRKIFQWYAFWLSAVMLFANFAIHFSVDIIYENETRVQQVFFLIITILYQSAYIVEIALLGVLYLLLPHCSGHPDRDSKPRLWRGLQIGHAIFLVILSILWAAALALKIKYQVDFVTSNYYDYDFHSIVKPFVSLDTSYSILYFFAAIEIVAWAVVGFVNKEKRSEHGKNLTTFLAAISLPLFIRSLYLMADVIYEELHQHTSTAQLALATNIVYILTTLPIYTGIVTICRDLVRKQGPVMPYQDPNLVGPAYWGGGDPSKNPMAVHEGGAPPPPVYSQGGYPSQGYYPQQQQPQQPMMSYQQQQQYPNPQQQYQHPCQNPAYDPYQHQHAPSPPLPFHQQQQRQSTIPQQHHASSSPPLPHPHAPSSPPPPPLHHQQQQQQQNRPPPSEMGVNGAGGGMGELPGPHGHGHGHGGLGYAR